jgi:hypothetical protein
MLPHLDLHLLHVGIVSGVGLNWRMGSRPGLYSRE